MSAPLAGSKDTILTVSVSDTSADVVVSADSKVVSVTVRVVVAAWVSVGPLTVVGASDVVTVETTVAVVVTVGAATSAPPEQPASSPTDSPPTRIPRHLISTM